MRPQIERSTMIVLLLALATPSIEAKTCLMLYQVADNNLEAYLREDYGDLAEAQIVAHDDLRTWVYFDASNQGGKYIPNTVNTAGNKISSTFHGSRYITYDQSIGQMRVDVELPVELDSDLSTTVQDFLEHAMQDCIQSGHDRFMAIFAGHGGGFAGYGGDDNVRRRSLLQSNRGVAEGIRAALDNVDGAPDRLEVIGFDACLMSDVGVADDYHTVARYMLASEAVVPGHGWSYDTLTNSTSPLDLAQDIFNNFLQQKQGRLDHVAPKTLAIVDTDKFVIFIDAFEQFIQELLIHMMEGDVSLYAFVSRARASSVAFEGVADVVGTSTPSALDIGSFMEHLNNLCNPSGNLGVLLMATQETYKEMFVSSGVGPGTVPGTGMQIAWPEQMAYNSDQDLWDSILFTDGDYVTQITPNYQAFMKYFLTLAAPILTDVSSVCGFGAQPDPTNSVKPGDLIIADSGMEDPRTGHFNVKTEITANVTQVKMEYGIDLSTPLTFLLDRGYTPQDDEYLHLLGGDVFGFYEGSHFRATWDQQFYFLNITQGAMSTNDNRTVSAEEFIKNRGYEALYVLDGGHGSRKIPVIYFPEFLREEVSRLQFMDYLFFDFEYFFERGARYSFLRFSVHEAVGPINDNLALFISDKNTGFAERPREAGGHILPLVYVDAYIQGRKIEVLPGGFHQTVIEWNTQLIYNILTAPAQKIFDVTTDTDAVMVKVQVFNKEAVSDVRYYDVIRKNRQRGNFTEAPEDITVVSKIEQEDDPYLPQRDGDDPYLPQIDGGDLFASGASDHFLMVPVAVGIFLTSWLAQFC